MKLGHVMRVRVGTDTFEYISQEMKAAGIDTNGTPPPDLVVLMLEVLLAIHKGDTQGQRQEFIRKVQALRGNIPILTIPLEVNNIQTGEDIPGMPLEKLHSELANLSQGFLNVDKWERKQKLLDELTKRQRGVTNGPE